MEKIECVDLRKYPKNSAVQENSYANQNYSVCIFETQDEGGARKKLEELADERLKAIAGNAISLNDYFTDNYQFFRNYKILKVLSNITSGDVIGGRLRKRAYNTLLHTDTHKSIDPREEPEVKGKRVIERIDALFCNKVYLEGLTPKQISKLAHIGFEYPVIKRLYKISPKENADELQQTSSAKNIELYEGIIDSTKYDALANTKGEFKGFTLNHFDIPKEYHDFVEAFLEDKEEISNKEETRFIDILKAFQTINAFNKKQQKGSAKETKNEDIEFFDLSGDGLLNKGDISAIELFIKVATDDDIKQKLAITQQEDWNDLSYLKEISKSKTDRQTKNLFDLNGDGNVDENDFALYHNIISNPNKFDINQDDFVNEKDIELTKKYIKVTLKRVKDAETFRKNTEEIMGGKKQLEITREKLK